MVIEFKRNQKYMDIYLIMFYFNWGSNLII